MCPIKISIAPDAENSLFPLLTQVKLLEDALVAIRRGCFEVIQKRAAFVDHHDQAPARGMILRVRFEMLSKLVDALGQKRDLDIGAAGVGFMDLEILNVILCLCCGCHI